VAWYRLTAGDWTPSSTCSYIGTLSAKVYTELKERFDSVAALAAGYSIESVDAFHPDQTIHSGSLILRDLEGTAMTWRACVDRVASVQRYMLTLAGFTQYREALQRLYKIDKRKRCDKPFRVVGLFTADKHLTEVCHIIGVPVWHVATGNHVPRSLEAMAQVILPCELREWPSHGFDIISSHKADGTSKSLEPMVAICY
jgi:hypothetical protein